MIKNRVKKLGKIEELENARLPMLKKFIDKTTILNEDEKENLILSIEYVIYCLKKIKNDLKINRV